MLPETLLRISFSVIGRRSLLSLLQEKCAKKELVTLGLIFSSTKKQKIVKFIGAWKKITIY
jgi:hypothetical protein